MSQKIICINRNCGSGGHIVGEMLAKELGISYYDHNLLDMALTHGGLEGIKAFEKVDEKAPNKAFYKLRYEGNENVESEKPANDMVFQLQRDLILQAAEKENFVIVGRCANWILEQNNIENLSVFIDASTHFRVKQIMERDQLSKFQAEIRVKQIDKRRGDYFYHYTKGNWKHLSTYDMILNSEKLGFEKCVKLLKDCYR